MKKEASAGSAPRRVLFGLFVFPLLVAVGMAVLLCSVVLLTSEQQTPESLIEGIKAGSQSQRWHNAYELSNELNRNPALLRNEAIMNEIIHVLSSPDRYDAKTRAYMAVALSHFDTPRSREVLRQRLEGDDSEVGLHALWSLGKLRASEAEEDVKRLLGSEDPQLRKMATYVLGGIGGETSHEPLEALLDDRTADVRWNAALSLSRLGSNKGYPVLAQMLDHEALKLHHRLTPSESDQVMANAVKGLALIGDDVSLNLLKHVSREAESLHVRQTALEALRKLDSNF